MQKTTIVIVKAGSELPLESRIESWGNLSEICRVYGWSYNYLKTKKFPFWYRGNLLVKPRYRMRIEDSSPKTT